jgi:hypothetical protein
MFILKDKLYKLLNVYYNIKFLHCRLTEDRFTPKSIETFKKIKIPSFNKNEIDIVTNKYVFNKKEIIMQSIII